MASLEPRSLTTAYDPSQVEHRIYQYWESGGFFKPTGDRNGKGPFSIVMPPPNVTGSLHIGHAWDNTLQDIIVRYKRLVGFDTLWVPGTDHAGIATQARVEKALREEKGPSRHELGRDAFIEKVWAWKEQYGNTITNQVRALGASCDWSRQRFTMDEGLSEAVREVFVRLYEKGLMYRGNRIINWCPRCGTALSDIEVEHVEQDGQLYHIAYPLVSGTGEVVIATTRPETMFADVAVAVHPDDPRYQHLVGQEVRLPLTNRTIPVIADSYVEPDFGTGCLKITPAHDPNDFEVGERHGLPKLQCIDADGRLNALTGSYQGLTREEARTKVAADLEAGGWLRQVETIHNAVGHCSRCDTVVEPFLSDQWFVRMQPLAEQALRSLDNGEIRFIPERFEKVFVHWLTNVRDWCVSRQLWWGHRIPAWYCADCGEITVSRDTPYECEHCQSHNIEQDEDVLDTWFSSALWPFSTMGWPSETEDFKRYYPTSALVTGYDILFFWVARMVFTGLEFTGKIPFSDVVLHGLIRAADGRKMSKSLGNGVDPMEVIGRYGADSLRFMLATGSAPGGDQRFHWERVESARNFLNKLWNAARFVLMNLPDDGVVPEIDWKQLQLTDRWILHRFAETVEETTRSLERYDFGEAGRALYDFTWDDFCDWYIEFSKLSLYGADEGAREQTRAVLVYVLRQLLCLLHPMVPFITEEIWQSIPGSDGALITATWPGGLELWKDPEVAKQISVVQEAVRSLRNLRQEMNLPPSRQISVVARTSSAESTRLVSATRPYLMRFGNIAELDVSERAQPPEYAVTVVVSGVELFVPLAGLVDIDAERQRLAQEVSRLTSEVDRAEKKLGNPKFVEKAPADVVASERAKLLDYQAKLSAVRERLRALEQPRR